MIEEIEELGKYWTVNKKDSCPKCKDGILEYGICNACGYAILPKEKEEELWP